MIAQQPIVVTDATFLDTDWSATVEAVTGGATQTAERVPAGGSPGSHRYMRHQMAAPSNLSVRHLYLGRAYDPAAEGALQAIDFGVDQLEIQPPFQGAAVGSGFFIVQDGRVHYAGTTTYTDLAWATSRLRCLRASDFTPANGVPPDFSANGGSIRFGFRRANTNDSTIRAYTVQHAADNFRVVLYRAGGPDCDREPPDLRLTKTDNAQPWSTQPLIAYQLGVSNLGGTASGVVLRETVPVNTDFVASASTTGWQCAGSGEGASCSLALGNLANGETRQAVFATRVRAGVDPAFDIYNLAAVNPEADDCTTNQLSGPTCNSAINCCFAAFLGHAGDQTCTQQMCNGVAAGPQVCTLAPTAAAGTSSAATRRALAGDDERVDFPLLYRLRDRVFHTTPGGRRATELYYRHSPELVTIAITNPAVLAAGHDALVSWQPLLRALVAGNGSTAIVSAELVAKIDHLLDLVLPTASPDLAAAIDQERQALDLASWIGRDVATAVDRLDGLSCEAAAAVLCLNGGRFRLEASWRTPDGRSGTGRAVPLTDDTGAFWFFDDDNVELVVKVIDACGSFDRFWVFAGGLTDVEVRLTASDTVSGERREYTNPQGSAYRPLQDTHAFASCP